MTESGYTPNDSKFSMKYYANDGHICDSLAEKIIDDHLYSKNIKHDRSVPYYPKCRFRADFQIEDKLIEYFGLLNQLSEYDKNVSIKIELAKKLNIKLISLYPKDLEDISMLDKKISNC